MPIRPATPGDVPHVLPMLRAQYALHASWDPAKFAVLEGFEQGYGRWLRARATDTTSVFLVAVDEGDIPIGFLIANIEHEMPLYVTKQYAFIHDLWVNENHRGKGLANALVAETIERFRNMGITQLRCETAYANEPARKLFATFGLRPSTVTMLGEI